MNRREIAYIKLKRIYSDGAYSNLVLSNEHPFVRRLVLGCVERRLTLDYTVSRLVKRKPDGDIMMLLHTGIYQLLYMDAPDSAVCDETTDIAKKTFGISKAGFVNAVLREVCRSRDGIMSDIASAPDTVKYSLGDSICRMIRREYPDDADAIMASFFEQKRLFARVNTLRSTAEDVASSLGGVICGATTVECPDASLAVAGLDSGEYFIQGIGSQTAVKWLEAKEGMTVADVCACPGGKTFGAAIDMNGNGRIYSSDIGKSKLSLISKGAKTLGISGCIEVFLADARTPDTRLLSLCDRVICDVPCTALGEIASRPEIRYKDINAQSALYKTQSAILESVSRLLKKGGRLVYSTCTLDRRENDGNVEAFIALHGGEFELIDSHTFLPHLDGCGEGFYVALISRR